MNVDAYALFSELGAGFTKGEPKHEAEVRDLLTDFLRETLELGRGEVCIEQRIGGKLVDVWVEPIRLAVEIKYHRPIPSGRNRPMTQQFGALLADIRKLALLPNAATRVLFLLSDGAGLTHITNKDLLPISDTGHRVITAADIAGLAASARGPAEAEGEWRRVRVVRVWHRKLHFGLTGVAWLVEPAEAVDSERSLAR